MTKINSRTKFHSALLIVSLCFLVYLMKFNNASITKNTDKSRKMNMKKHFQNKFPVWEYGKNDKSRKVNLKKHFQFELPVWEHETSCSEEQQREECGQCSSRPELWDCVGEDRSWSVVIIIIIMIMIIYQT